MTRRELQAAEAGADSFRHPERLFWALSEPKPLRRRRGSLGLILAFAAVAGLLALAVRFYPLSHPAAPPRPGASIGTLS